MFTLAVQWEKGRKISKVFRRLPSGPKVELKSSEDFELAQRIRKLSKVHQSILKTNRFLIYWLMEIQSDSLLYGHEKGESICFSFLQRVVLWLKDCLLNLKKMPQGRTG